MDTNFKFELGDELEDTLTGYSGVCVYRTQWLTNCNVYGLQPRGLREGKIREREQFDEPRLRIVEQSVATPSRDTGGETDAMKNSNRMG